MHGVSEVIAIILILMITIAIAGLAYTFMSSTISSTTSAATSAVTTTTSSMLTSFTIESMDAAKVYVRNTGQSTLSNLSVYVNDEPAIFNVSPVTISAGQVGTIMIYSFIPDGATVKVVSTNGFSVSIVANPCSRAVGCWKFDESSGSIAYDSSNYANDLRILGMPNITWSNGKINGGVIISSVLSIVCTNQGATITNNAPLSNSFTTLPSGQFTVAFLIRYATSRLGTWFHLSTPYSSNGASGFFGYSTSVQTTNSTGQTNAVSFTNNLALNEWHYIVYMFDNAVSHKHSLYADGIKVAEGSISGSFGSINRIDIGVYDPGCEDATSGNSIDEFRIYSSAIF